MSFDSATLSSLMQNVNFIDIALALWLILAAFHGFAAGLIRMLGNIVGLIFGVVVAGWYYEGLASWGIAYLPSWLQGFSSWIQILAFALIFIAFTKITGLIFEAFNTLFNAIAIIPLLSTFNRFLGLVLSTFEAVLTIATLIFLLSRYPVLSGIQTTVAKSSLAQKISTVTPILEPLYPQLLKQLPDLYTQAQNVKPLNIDPTKFLPQP
jgi:membrane protein required for colicin V production